MKVLVLGLPRTGTQCKLWPLLVHRFELRLNADSCPALADALTHIGFGPIYHMREVGKNHHQALWIEAIEAKFEGKGKPWGRDEFEKVFAGFEVPSTPS